MVTSAEQFVVVIRYGVRVTPAFRVFACQYGLWLTVSAELRVYRSVAAPYLVGFVSFPCVAEFRAECPSLKRFPVQAHVVALLQAVLVFVRVGYTFRWSTLLRGAVLGVLVAVGKRFQGRYLTVCATIELAALLSLVSAPPLSPSSLVYARRPVKSMVSHLFNFAFSFALTLFFEYPEPTMILSSSVCE